MRHFLGLVLLSMACAGCGLNSKQDAELRAMQNDRVAVQEKSTGTAAAQGILPGWGFFYTRQWGIGIVDLLTWPFSVLWDPISGYNEAKVINYDASRDNVKRMKKKEITELDKQLEDKKITQEAYTLEVRKVEKKYDYD